MINSESVMLVDRAETIDVTVEAEPLTTINPFQLAVNQTQTPVIVQHVTIVRHVPAGTTPDAMPSGAPAAAAASQIGRAHV